MENKPTLEQLIALSKEHPERLIKVDDGRVIANGEVFKNERAFKDYIAIAAFVFKMHNFFRRITFRKPL